MKKTKTIKIYILILTFLLLFGLASCNASRSGPEAQNSDGLQTFFKNLLGIQNSDAQVYDVDFFVGNGKNVKSVRTDRIEKEPETSLAHYDFGGWYDNSQYQGKRITFPYEVTRNMTLYAKWYKHYSVSFETNGGEELDDLRAGYIEKTPITTRQGFNFKGWFTTEDFQEESLISFPYEVTSDKRFYAKWVTAGAYTITTAQELLDIRYGLDAANVYTLGNDIDFHTPLGRMEIEPIANKDLPFKGTFNGNGKTISNFSITETDDFQKYYGLFGAIGKEATIKDLTIKDAYIKLDSNYMFYAGGIVGYVEGGKISNCIVQNAEFTGDGKEIHLGAIAGYLDSIEIVEGDQTTKYIGEIKDSKSIGGNIRSRSAEQEINVGGIVGYIEAGSVTNCSSNAIVSGRITGGIAGSNKGSITNCSFEGSAQQPLSYTTIVKKEPITEYTTIVGGIAGNNYAGGLVTQCYTIGTVKGKWAGGIVGINGPGSTASITNCYSTSAVISDYRAGGIAGHNEGATITNCFNNGSVEAKAIPVAVESGGYTGGSTSNVFAGGIVGHNQEGSIERCLNYVSIAATCIQPNVDASRPQLGDYNPAFAGSIVGFSTKVLSGNYSLQGLTITRNNVLYTLNEDNIFYSAEVRQNETFIIVPGNEYAANLFFRTVLGYSTGIWALKIDGTSITLSFA